MGRSGSRSPSIRLSPFLDLFPIFNRKVLLRVIRKGYYLY
ncbi:hypothetical protein LEP1GSC050_2303 [Leptospira broomii serovar Hurstbridge str. 5399]|uniref:Uncharacterized protein n=1 Tax=Leptospira broomii serovar Hurstbridge str. 5399 TaxID=1049789 RepID=T0GBG0_9LEPT|nr:hypothetical protein LEP1GSC050_2303 [Leptospira broomii serovar Hurstbridge str. 5399]